MDLSLSHMRSSAFSGHLLAVDGAFRLACEGQLAAIVQQNAAERAMVNLRLGPLLAGDGKELGACTARRIPATTFGGAK